MTARVYPSQQQTNLTTIGSLLVSYDEVNQSTNVSQVQCYVNSVERKLIHNNNNNLYSTFITNGDIVRILVTTTSDDNEINVTRRDYTTDDQGGDMGIRDVYITGVTGNSPTTLEVTFTVSPISLDYNFEYLVSASVKIPLTPTPTPSSTPGLILPIIESGLTINVNGTYPSYPGTGTTWYDLENNYNGDLINGPTWNSGTGGYFSFDGVNDYCYFGDASKGSDTVSKTFGGWIRTPTSGTTSYLFSRGEDGSPSGSTNGWNLFLRVDSANDFQIGVVTGDLPGTLSIGGTTKRVGNTWYYVIGRWTSGGGISIFINGVNEGNFGWIGAQTRFSTVGWQIAKFNGTTYQADIGDFELYERALSNAEILQNYNARKSIYSGIPITQTPTPTPTKTTTPTPTPVPVTPTPTNTPTTTPAVLNSAGGKFDYDFQNFRTYNGTGLIFNDVTNSGNYATLITGATYQGSVSPYYYNMDSTYATSLYNPGNYYGYLYGGWFKVETTGVANIFMFKDDGLKLGITSGNTIYAYFQNVVGQTNTLSGSYMVPGYWYYIMAYYDYGIGGSLFLYVNGALDGYVANPWGISNPNLEGTGTPFIIGNGAPTQSFQLGEAECYAQFYGGIANVPTIVSTNFSRKLQFYSIYIPPTPTPTPTPTSTPVPVTLDYFYRVGSLGNTQWAKQVVGLRMYGNDQTTPCIAQPASIETFPGASTTGITTNFCSFTNNTLRCVRGINYRRPVGAGGTVPRVNTSLINLYKNGVFQQTQSLAAFNVPNGATTTRYDTITFTGLSISGGETWRIEWVEI